jgi:hypothetical protein
MAQNSIIGIQSSQLISSSSEMSENKIKVCTYLVQKPFLANS